MKAHSARNLEAIAFPAFKMHSIVCDTWPAIVEHHLDVLDLLVAFTYSL